MKIKKRLLIFIITMIYSICMSISAFADTESWMEIAQQEILEKDSVLLPMGITSSVDFAPETRGRYIANSSVNVSNEGYGILGVYAHTLAYESVKKIRMNLYLDQWDDQAEDWVQISSKSLTYNNEDGAEDLHAVSESFTVENLEIGKYYRVRGYHAVWSFDGLMESHGTVTNGVLLTDGPA